MMEIKFSSVGSSLAVSCRDNLIHILEFSLTGKQEGVRFKRVAVCRGHNSFARSLDFSRDGLVLQSSDGGKELFFWDAQSGQRVNAAAVRDELWESWTSIVGWPVMGALNTISFGGDVAGNSGKNNSVLEDANPGGGVVAVSTGDVNCVCRSPDGTLLAVGSSQTVKHTIKLFNFPCPVDAVPSVFGGHTSPVIDIAFVSHNDASSLSVISAGGNDCCIFQWGVVSKR